MNIFVYGTLRRGYGNHRLLTDSKFLGDAVTNENYAMFGGGIPFVNKHFSKYPIQGEIYEVNAHTLARLDALEGHPDWYYREPIKATLKDSGEVVDAELYFNDYAENPFPTGDFKENRPSRIVF